MHPLPKEDHSPFLAMNHGLRYCGAGPYPCCITLLKLPKWALKVTINQALQNNVVHKEWLKFGPLISKTEKVTKGKPWQSLALTNWEKAWLIAKNADPALVPQVLHLHKQPLHPIFPLVLSPSSQNIYCRLDKQTATFFRILFRVKSWSVSGAESAFFLLQMRFNNWSDSPFQRTL